MRNFVVKYYNLWINTKYPMNKTNVQCVSDIEAFVVSVARETGKIWHMLESKQVEKSLLNMGENDWLKVAIPKFTSYNQDSDEQSFIILTQKDNDYNTCLTPINEYTLIRNSGTYFRYNYTYTLWYYCIYTPWIIGLVAVYLSCCCAKAFNPRVYIMQQYKQVNSVPSGV